MKLPLIVGLVALAVVLAVGIYTGNAEGAEV